MARVPRSSLPEGFVHVVSRAAYGARIYLDDVDRRRFVRLLEDSGRRVHWSCAAYCLMSTHYHLVLEARPEQVSTGMQLLNGRYALGFNRRRMCAFRGCPRDSQIPQDQKVAICAQSFPTLCTAACVTVPNGHLVERRVGT